LLAEEEGVGSGQHAEGLCLHGHVGAARRHAYFGLRHEYTRCCNEAQHSEGVRWGQALQWGTREGEEGVDRDGLRVLGLVGQSLQQFAPVLNTFPQAQNTAAADVYAGLAYMPQGLQALLIAAGGDNVGIKLRGGVQVMVIGVEAGLFEALSLGGRQHTEGSANLEAQAAYLANHFEDGLEGGALPHLPPGGPHTKAGGPCFFGFAGGLEDFFQRHEFLHRECAGVAYGLGAIGAVLGAAAGFNGEQAAQLDGVPGAKHSAVYGHGLKNQVHEGQVVQGAYFLEAPVMAQGEGGGGLAMRVQVRVAEKSGLAASGYVRRSRG